MIRQLRERLRGIDLDLRVSLTAFDHSRDPATVEQLRLIDRLCDDRLLVSPTWQPLSQRQATTITTQLLDGTYNPRAWE